VLFSRLRYGIVEKPIDGGAERLLLDTRANASMLSNDGRFLVGFEIGDAGNRDIVVVPLTGEAKPFRFAQSPANETQPALSPDNRSLAYVSDEIDGNTRHVLVQAFPGGGRKLQVSGSAGGVQPRWRRDGKELLFVDGEGWITSAPVLGSGDALRLGAPERLFQTGIDFQPGLGTRANYDVTNDGSRFVVAEPRHAEAERTSVNLVMNWTRLLPQ
jgi:dipeptidyl aminopeptidase/acylaminoacyl peptidase